MASSIIVSILEYMGEIFKLIDSSIPSEYRVFFNLGLFLILLTIYSIFVWKFYRFVARRDIIELNLKQYNSAEHPVLKKIFAFALFMFEYLIIMPLVVFFFFLLIAIILLLVAKEHSIENILLISASIVGVVRICSYYKQELARDIAKLFPFTILFIALVTPGFFDFSDIIGRLSVSGQLIGQAFVFLLGIIVLEAILRLFYLIGPQEKEDGSK